MSFLQKAREKSNRVHKLVRFCLAKTFVLFFVVFCVSEKPKLVHLVVETDSETSVVPLRSQHGSTGTLRWKSEIRI